MTKPGGEDRDDLPGKRFASPERRRMPIGDVTHVRRFVARFDQVIGVSDAEKEAAWKRVRPAADTHGVEPGETSWREPK